LLLTPAAFADRLPLSESSRVLEVGPGSGFFSAELAERASRGHLELLDLQRQMLAKARRKLDSKGFKNVGYTEADASGGLPFPASSFDAAVLVSVLGEIPERANALQSLHQVLRPGGVLAIHEQIPDADRIEFEELQTLVETQGFKFQVR
jgi:ubiquinone/menaquinone biosynthesis C-methylase UbiE